MGVVKINRFDANNVSAVPVHKNAQTFGISPASYSGYWGRLQTQREVAKASSPWSRRLKFLGGEGSGEILNTLMTAFGTAVVAPIFIVWNPFAKEDKETRTYSAWRQPVSAIIAVAFQYSINSAYDSYLAKKASLGAFDLFDLRWKPRENYLISKIKKEAKKAGEKLSDEQIIKRVDQIRRVAFNDALLKTKETFADKLPTYKQLVEPELYDGVSKKVMDDKDFLKKLEGLSKPDKQAKIDERIFADAAKKVEAELVNSAKKKAYIIKMQDEVVSGRAKDFDAAYKLIRSEIGQAYRTNPERFDFKNIQARLKGDVKNSTMRLIDGNEFYTSKLGFDKVVSTGLNKFRLEFKKELADLKIALEHAKQVGGVEEAVKSGKTFQQILSHEKIKKFVKVSIKKAEKSFGKYKNTWGIILSLTTLPFSCGLLNWAYPRIMEYIMPEVVKNKKQRHDNYYYPASTKVKPSESKDKKAEVGL